MKEWKRKESGKCRRKRSELKRISHTHLDTVPLLLPLIHFIFYLNDLQLQLLFLQ